MLSFINGSMKLIDIETLQYSFITINKFFCMYSLNTPH